MKDVPKLNHLMLAILSASTAITLASCDSNSKKEDEPVVIIDEQPIETVQNDPITLTFNFVDFSGNAIVESGVISVLNDSLGLISEDSITVTNGNAQVSATTLPEDNDNNGEPDEAASLSLAFSGFTGYITNQRTISIDSYGNTDISVRLLGTEGADTVTVAQEIVEVASTTVTETTEVVFIPPTQSQLDAGTENASADVLQTPVSTATNATEDDLGKPQATAYVPADFVAYDENGDAVDTDSLTITVVAISPEEAAGLGAATENSVVDVGNQLDVEEAVASGDLPQELAEAKEISLTTAGSTLVTASDSGSQVDAIDPATPITVEIAIAPGTVNPETGEIVEIGDEMPIWSKGDTEGSWNYEGVHEITVNDQGDPVVILETSHLSYFNAAFAKATDTCSGKIYIKGIDAQGFAETGEFHLENAEISIKDVYRGTTDAAINFNKVPNEISNLFFKADNGNVKFVPNLTTVTLANGGAVTDSGITGLNLCESNGATIVLAEGIGSEPVLSYSIDGYNYRYSRGGVDYIYLSTLYETDAVTNWRKNSEEITFTLLNAPSTPVTFDYSFMTPSDYVATSGVDFTDSQNGQLTLSAANPTATISLNVINDDIPEYRYERIQFSINKPSNASLVNDKDTLTFSASIYDDDPVQVESVVVNDVTEGDTGEVVIKFKNPLPPGFRYFSYSIEEDNSAEADSVTVINDFDSVSDSVRNRTTTPYFNSYNKKSYLSSSVWLYNNSAGLDQVTLQLNTIDDESFEGDESFTLRLSSYRYFQFPDTNSSYYSSMALTRNLIDNDPEPTVPPTSFTVELYDRNDNLIDTNTVNEGQSVFGKIRLNTAAVEDISFTITESGGDIAPTIWGNLEKFSWNFGEYVTSESGNNTVVTLPAGSIELPFTFTTVYNWHDFEDYTGAALSITPEASANLDIAKTVNALTVVDTTQTYISWYMYTNATTLDEDAGDDIDVTFSYYSNNPNASFTLSDVGTQGVAISPATLGTDYTLEGSINTFTGNSMRQTLSLGIIDDELIEFSEQFDIKANSSTVSPADAYFWRRNVSRRITITDNDIPVLFTADKAYNFSSNVDFAGKITVSISTDKVMPIDAEFVINLLDDKGFNFAQSSQIVSITSGETTAIAEFTINDTTATALGLSTSNRTTSVPLTFNVQLTAAGKQTLTNSGVDQWVFSKADAVVTMNVEYTATSTTGASSGGGSF